MHKKLSVLALTLLLTFSIQAQEKIVIENNDNYKFQSEKNKPVQTTTIYKSALVFQPSWSFGGNLGLSFWNGGTDIFLAPKAYYHLSPQFITGVGVTYIYSDNDGRNFGYHSNSIGGSISALFRPIPFLQLSAEFEELHTDFRGRSGYYPYQVQSYWNEALYLGASFVSGPVSFGIRYDVLYDKDRSVYGDAWTPFIGVYF